MQGFRHRCDDSQAAEPIRVRHVKCVFRDHMCLGAGCARHLAGHCDPTATALRASQVARPSALSFRRLLVGERAQRCVRQGGPVYTAVFQIHRLIRLEGARHLQHHGGQRT
jgi:hypothetical protein